MFDLDINENDIITTDGYLDICNNNPDIICHIKTDYFKNGNFIWRGEQHPSKILKNVIISHSDLSVIDSYCNKFEKIFCVNNETTLNNVFSLPLGIPNSNIKDGLPILEIIGDKQSLISVMGESYDRNDLLVINFNESTYPSERNELKIFFSEFNWCNNISLNYDREGRLDYLRGMKKSMFTLCPRGNGVDTHRLWESLYMGSIPIIKYEKTYESCSDLPVLFINDWSTITENFLIKKYEEIKHKKYNLEKLKLSFWKNFIINNI